jgi:hypothetical protein
VEWQAAWDRITGRQSTIIILNYSKKGERCSLFPDFNFCRDSLQSL